MIALRHAVFGYGTGALFPPLSVRFNRGSLTAVIGSNGAGKSTLLKTIAGLLPLQGGRIDYGDSKFPSIAYLPQQAELDRQFPVVVNDVVAMGCWRRWGMLGGLTASARAQIAEALATVGMSQMTHAPVSELSGGQLQRVLFARLLTQQAPLILLDEPFTGIDSATIGLLLRVIARLHQQGKTVIAVLHDMAMVAGHFPQALLLTQHDCHWGDADRVLAQLPLLHAANASVSRIKVVP